MPDMAMFSSKISIFKFKWTFCRRSRGDDFRGCEIQSKKSGNHVHIDP
jgi:hypothetical protein